MRGDFNTWSKLPWWYRRKKCMVTTFKFFKESEPIVGFFFFTYFMMSVASAIPSHARANVCNLYKMIYPNVWILSITLLSWWIDVNSGMMSCLEMMSKIAERRKKQWIEQMILSIVKWHLYSSEINRYAHAHWNIWNYQKRCWNSSIRYHFWLMCHISKKDIFDILHNVNKLSSFSITISYISRYVLCLLWRETSAK